MQENNKKISFNKICDEWLSFKKPIVKEATYLNYKFTINKHLYKYFKDKELEYFTHYDINKYIQILQENLANKTVREIVTVLKSILRYAERKYDIDFKLDLISLPKVTSKEIEIFSEKEKAKLEKYILSKNNIRYFGILISLYAGLRIGEICALKWSDIDFENKLIKVTHTLQRVYVSKKETKVIYTKPKTKNSIRKIPMSKIIFEKLKELNKRIFSKCFYINR